MRMIKFPVCVMVAKIFAEKAFSFYRVGNGRMVCVEIYNSMKI